METARRLPRLSFGSAGIEQGSRPLPEEVAVALSFNGSTQAVMMATPADLADFAYGFALTEGIATPDQIDSVDIVPAGEGVDVQIWVKPEAEQRLAARRRTMAGPVGCGLCGIDSIEQAMRPVAQIAPSPLRMSPAQVMRAVASLTDRQPLHDYTRAAHCAAYWTAEGMVAAREDVGRHNALDKVLGALARAGTPAGAGFIAVTSRASYEMVQKTASAGVNLLAAVSGVTGLAIDTAQGSGVTLLGFARGQDLSVYSHPQHIQL